jgi:hypothetical protein
MNKVGSSSYITNKSKDANIYMALKNVATKLTT